MVIKIRAEMKITRSSSLWNIVFVLTMVVYAVGLFIDIMEPDAAVYAQVSMEMHDRGDLLSIYHKGNDWLDKPHFPFWMSAISYEIFGVSTFAYKLPAVLFILLGSLYTFLFARRFYSSLQGWLAVLILITAQHIIISNHDVRAEPFLTGLVIMALYHFATIAAILPIPSSGGVAPPAGPLSRKFSGGGAGVGLHLILGSLALSCLIMTKGLFTIIPVVAGIGLSLLYSNNFRTIFNWRWLVALILVGVFLFPSLYGYYLQFDRHPEKTIFGKNNVSGVEFFLWTSQWGRFTNTGPITGKGDISYFVHTMLWAFLPWAFMGFFALFQKTKQLIRRKTTGENFTYFGFITLFLIFSFSKFQLSFYLNPLFPLLAILTTAVILNQRLRTLRTFSIIHLVLSCLLVVALFLLHYFFLNNIPHIDTIIIVLIGLAAGFHLFFRSNIYLKKIFFATALICLSINYYLNREFYPALLTYQAESQVAHYMKARNIPADQIVFVGDVQSVADIILHYSTPIVAIDSVAIKDISNKYVFTSPEGKEKIDSLGLKYSVVETFPDFHVTRITGKFINKKTRSAELQQKFLLKIDEADFSKPGVQLTFK
jgi:4-amino-4-deoxy-L-arabinose transferase-like glycosyltransferase